MAAARLQSSYDFLHFNQLNIEISPAAQEYENKKFDLIIATNVLHATRNIKITLSHVKSLLNPNGILILNEGIFRRDYSTLVYGLTDGWWAFEDENDRIPGSPFLSLAQWREKLVEMGGKQFISLNELLQVNFEVFQDVIIVLV